MSVHWTDPVDRSQTYIPMASPFVTKLATVAAAVHSERPFDVIYSHYLEPYGVAGHLASQMAGVPHVARMAGAMPAGSGIIHNSRRSTISPAVGRNRDCHGRGRGACGRARRRRGPHCSAEGPWCRRTVHPEGPVLDLSASGGGRGGSGSARFGVGRIPADRPYFGVYGKLGENKGSFALLAAMAGSNGRIKVGLVALAHGRPTVEKRFRARARKLGLANRVLQLPFLPHWRVPAFLRGCLAVCCLEQDFPIGFHSRSSHSRCCFAAHAWSPRPKSSPNFPPMGGCRTATAASRSRTSTTRRRSAAQLAAIARDPGPAAAVGARGRAFARDLQRDATFPQTLEHILATAAARQRVGAATSRTSAATAAAADACDFPLTRLAELALEQTGRSREPSKRSKCGGRDSSRRSE